MNSPAIPTNSSQPQTSQTRTSQTQASQTKSASVCLEDVQGVVVYAYKSRPRAVYYLLQVRRGAAAAARQWLRSQLPQVGHAGRRSKVDLDPDSTQVALAFTHAGLRALGVNEASLATFSPEFQQGMAHPSRARVLGDTPEDWQWGSKGKEAHLLVAGYGRKHEEIRKDLGIDPQVFAVVREVVSEIEIFVETDTENPRRTKIYGPGLKEPFGFHDGISQPHIAEFERPDLHKAGQLGCVALGEFLFGYRNQLGYTTAMPRLVHDSSAPPAKLNIDDASFGSNGSLLVVREIEQHVDKFTQLDLATRAKLVGRWPNGTPLVVDPDKSRLGHVHGDGANDFTYHGDDPHGVRCPLGAHVRRANPRDALADPSLPVSREEALQSTNRHRLLRRGRSYSGAGQVRGTFFMCFNTSLERQFEFVQQNWIANDKFAGLSSEADCMAGASTLSIPTSVQPEHLSFASFVSLRGGAYFFLPSISALRRLAE